MGKQTFLEKVISNWKLSSVELVVKRIRKNMFLGE
jgi:hypothetical protein